MGSKRSENEDLCMVMSAMVLYERLVRIEETLRTSSNFTHGMRIGLCHQSISKSDGASGFAATQKCQF